MATAGAAIASVTVVAEAIVAAVVQRPVAAVMRTAADRSTAAQRFPIPAVLVPAQATQQVTQQLRMPAHRTQQHRIAAVAVDMQAAADLAAAVAVGMKAAAVEAVAAAVAVGANHNC
jgi:ribosomal protein L1